MLDKWNALFAGGQVLGLSSIDKRHRLPVGYALAYYLIGAVLLDLNAAKLHKMTAKGQNMQIGDISTIREAVKREVRARRYLYWTMLGRYLLFHVWSLAVASTLLWAFDGTRESTLLFLAYVVAYTGLLWYQVGFSSHSASALTFWTVHESIFWSSKFEAADCRRLN